MNRATDFEHPPAPESPTAGAATRRSGSAVAVRLRPAAGNDADYDASSAAPVPGWPGITRVYRAARSLRARWVRDFADEGFETARAFVRRARALLRQHREARSARAALAGLDDRALRDLGLDRSEITSIAAEVAGLAERTRMRALHP